MQADVHLYPGHWYLPRANADLSILAPAQLAQGGVLIPRYFSQPPLGGGGEFRGTGATGSWEGGLPTLMGSWDPNDLQGSPATSHVPLTQRLGFLVRFENLAQANLAAQNVTVTVNLDPNLDWDSATVDGVSHPSVYSAATDPVSRTISWRFTGINLPPNKTPPEGEGWLRFSVSPRKDIPSGSQVRIKARIFFDENPPIDTNEVHYVIDYAAPTSSILEQRVEGDRLTLRLQAQDDASGAGVSAISLFYTQDGKQWLSAGSAVTSTVPITGTGVLSGTLTFSRGGAYWVAPSSVDALGNSEPLTTTRAISVTLPYYLYAPAVLKAAQGGW